MILGPLALGAAVDVDGDAVLVGSHHPLDLVFLEGSHEVVVAVGTVLKEPSSYNCEKEIQSFDVLHSFRLI